MLNLKDITTWSVSKGVATPKKVDRWGDDPSDHKKIGYNRYGFSDEEAQQRTYATDAPDGSYSAGCFGGVVWQSRLRGFNTVWTSVLPIAYERSDKDFEKYREYCDGMEAFARKFLPFIHQVKETQFEKAGGVVIPTKNITNMKEAESPKFGEWISEDERCIKLSNGNGLLAHIDIADEVVTFSNYLVKFKIDELSFDDIVYLATVINNLPSPPKTL